MEAFKKLSNGGNEVASEAGAGLHVEIRVRVPNELPGSTACPNIQLRAQASLREVPFGKGDRLGNDGDGWRGRDGRGLNFRRCRGGQAYWSWPEQTLMSLRHRPGP